MKKNQLLILHFLYWTIYLIGSVIIPIFVMKGKYPVLDVTFFTTNFICFYINFFFVVPRFFDLKNIFKIILGFFISVCCFVIIRFLIEETILPHFTGIRNYAEGTTFGYYFFDNIYFSSTIIFVSTVFGLFQLISKSEEERLQLITEKKNAELQALKTQINPHFIFNSLNNIYSLVYQNSEKSLPAIEELSQLLRYSTKDLEREFIPLEREFGYVESLIALEKLRIKNPELIIVTNEIKNLNLLISPMLIVPFVENAFKHGDFSNKGFDLKISTHENKLHFYLENFKKPKKKDAGSGIGIDNVRKRLDLIYPNKHSLQIINKDTFIVDLKIELNDE